MSTPGMHDYSRYHLGDTLTIEGKEYRVNGIWCASDEDEAKITITCDVVPPPRIRIWDADWFAIWESDTTDQTLEDWLTDQNPGWYHVTSDYKYRSRWSGMVRRTAYGLEWFDIDAEIQRVIDLCCAAVGVSSVPMNNGIEDLYEDTWMSYWRYKAKTLDWE